MWVEDESSRPRCDFLACWRWGGSAVAEAEDSDEGERDDRMAAPAAIRAGWLAAASESWCCGVQ